MVCEAHERVKHMLLPLPHWINGTKIGLNNMHSKIGDIHANCACRCVDVCYPIDVQDVGNYYANQITGLVDLSSPIFCPKPVSDEWHKQDCVMGDCSSCGINTLKVCPTEEFICVSRTVQWRQYAKIVVG